MYKFITLIVCLFAFSQDASADSAASGASKLAVKRDMNKVYHAFRSLNSYMVSEERFFAQASEREISNLLRLISGNFHRIEDMEESYSREPGFASTLKIISQVLDDAKGRFAEGKKDYALWRLKVTSNYCISCHARIESHFDFSGQDEELAQMTAFERAEFFFATRQFEKAKPAYIEAVRDPELPFLRLKALRKWLVIYTRVQPNPLAAIGDLTRIREEIEFSKYENQELKSWLASLRRWQNESSVVIDELRKAKHLISQGINMNEVQPAIGAGAVELLRGTAILHKLLSESGKKYEDSRASILLHLGIAYLNLSEYLANELPEMFLEQCIRDYPGSNEAKVSYQKYYDKIVSDYTGSGGTNIPPDVRQVLRELYELAYGKITAEAIGRI